MAKEVHSNPELASPSDIFREVNIAVQDSTNATIVLTTFFLLNGQWDPSAPNGVPTQGFTLQPGATGVWGNYTPTPFTAVGGQMTFQGSGAGMVTINWTWNYGSPPSCTATVTGSSIQASVTLSGVTSNKVTAQVVLSGNN